MEAREGETEAWLMGSGGGNGEKDAALPSPAFLTGSFAEVGGLPALLPLLQFLYQLTIITFH